MSNENKEPLSNVPESVENAKWAYTDKLGKYRNASIECHHNTFVKGSEWQKEQDNTIIKELIDVIKMFEWSELNGEGESQREGKPRLCTRLEISERVINKAENHLKNK